MARGRSAWWRSSLGAIVFLFPFYYMVVGALQREPSTDIAGAFPDPANLTLDNFADINSQVDLVRTLVNSGIFTGGVLLATLVIGLLAGYALAPAAVPRPHPDLHGDAADPRAAVPALHDPALRAHRARRTACRTTTSG